MNRPGLSKAGGKRGIPASLSVPTKTIVPLGRLVMTPGVQSHVAQSLQLQCIRRHERGDWGDVCDEDRGANESALRYGTRLLSVYKLEDDTPECAGLKLWIITEADRSATTLLLPEEY